MVLKCSLTVLSGYFYISPNSMAIFRAYISLKSVALNFSKNITSPEIYSNLLNISDEISTYHLQKISFINISDTFVLKWYPASRVFFDLPRLVGKRKKTLPRASRIHIEHAPKSNVTKPRSASLSSCDEMTGKKIHCIITSLK